ncbi:hypothetical protein [Clostridium sp.]|jgi:hypothetical protein|uniref:hypothetical protein n=1 Tax=Clostridium sp. TaxID=1506 RepID=UPI0039F452F0
MRKVLLLTLLAIIYILTITPKVFAKAVVTYEEEETSRSLKDEVTVGIGEAYDYNDINAAIQNIHENGVVKIEGGEYHLNQIENKNVILESLDNNYVDIIVENIHKKNLLKLGSKVTINIKDTAPVRLSLSRKLPGTQTEYTESGLDIDVDKGSTVSLLIRQDIINELGLHECSIMMSISNGENVIVRKAGEDEAMNGTVSEDGTMNYKIYDLKSYYTNTGVHITFNEAGRYIIQIWSDDGREN